MSEDRFGSWSVAESPITIEYSLVLLEEIRHEVAEGYQKLSRGGMEVGGVLYGVRDGQTISAQAMRPIACEHARGPSFLLSDPDREALRQQLIDDAADPRLEGMICLGWFLSHTRSEIVLSDSDREIFSEFFGSPWQVTLVVRPGRGGSMRAGFFVREADGTIKSDSSYLEFNFPDRLAGVLDRPPRSERAPLERRSLSYPRHENGPALPLQRDPRGPLPSMFPEPSFLPEPKPAAKWPWLLGSAVVLILAVVLAMRFYMMPIKQDPIALTVAERDGQLDIGWNPAAKSISGAAHGELTIVDGKATRTVALTPQDLARGSFFYQRSSGDIEIRLAVESPTGDKVEKATGYLGQPIVHVNPDELKDLEQQRDQLQSQVDRLTKENAAQAEQIQELQRTLRILRAR